jgi:ribonuclease-3
LKPRASQPPAGKATTALGYQFSDDSLRRRALTHRSANSEHNERLEFLGDALLGLLVAEYLFEHFPHADEGQLTRTRASLVNRESLAEVARALDLGTQLVLGEGELKSGGWRRDSILANALEALIGAIYIDGGIAACRQVIMSAFAQRLDAIDPSRAIKDPKTALQELLQSRHHELPRYETTAVAGPSHEQEFTVACHTAALPEPVLACGRSRRKAEQAAALAAMQKLRGLS